MKKAVYGIWVSMILVLCLLPVQNVLSRAEFDIYNGDVQVWIEEDGDVKFRQCYSYEVDSMNGALINVLTSGHRVSNYSAGIMDESLNKPIYFKETGTEDDQTFEVTETGDEYTFKLYHPVEDETVHFFVEYTLEQVIQNYADTAVFNWKIIGTGIDDNLDVSAKVYLPGPVKEDEHFRVWGHGSPHGHVHPIRQANEAYVEVEVPNNQANTFVEVNTLFPERLTSRNTNKKNINMLDELTAQEDRRVLQDKKNYEQSRTNTLIGIGLASLMGPIAIAASIITYRKKMKTLNPNPAHVPKHIYRPPEAIAPAVAAYAYKRDLVGQSSTDLAATILDLTRRGYLSLEEVERSWGRKSVRVTVLKEKDDQLSNFEQDAYDFVRPYRNKPVVLSDIGDIMKKDEEYKKKQRNYVEHFVKKVKKIAKNLMDLKQFPWESFLLLMGFISSLVMTIIMIVFGFIYHVQHILLPLALTFGIVSMIFVGKQFYEYNKHPLLNYEEDKKRQEWKSFDQMLKDIGQMDMREIAELPLWEEYLVYAFAFGSAEKVIKAMKVQFDTQEFEQAAFPAYVYANDGAFVTMFDESLTEAVSSNSSFGSSGYAGNNIGGGGGGFSSGSSGGGGGGGAGGF